MFGFKNLLLGFLTGGIAMMLAMQYHIVHTASGIITVPRASQTPVRSAYVDIREWTPAMWEHYPEVSEALVKSGRGNLVNNAGATNPQFVPSLPNLGYTAPAHSANPGANPLQSLVPIRFMDQPGAAASIPAPSNSATVNAPATRENGLPVLSQPVPIPQEESFARQTSVRSGSAQSGGSQQSAAPTSSWIRGLLKSLTPSPETEQAIPPQQTSVLGNPGPFGQPTNDQVLPDQGDWPAAAVPNPRDEAIPRPL